MIEKTLSAHCAGRWLTILLRLSVFAATLQPPAYAETAQPTNREQAMRVAMLVNGESVTISLENNQTSRDFVALLPLDLTLEDYAASEKITTLSRKLSTQDAAPGITPVTGDFAYYAPWGNIAIFYKGFTYSPGLIKLGALETNLDIIRQPSPLNVRFELINH